MRMWGSIGYHNICMLTSIKTLDTGSSGHAGEEDYNNGLVFASSRITIEERSAIENVLHINKRPLLAAAAAYQFTLRGGPLQTVSFSRARQPHPTTTMQGNIKVRYNLFSFGRPDMLLRSHEAVRGHIHIHTNAESMLPRVAHANDDAAWW